MDYGQLNKKTLNHPRSIPSAESPLEKIASCRYKTKMDKNNWFWLLDLKQKPQVLLAFIYPQGRVLKWKVMPFGVANAAAFFKELMSKTLSIPRCRPVVQEIISRGSRMEAFVNDVCMEIKKVPTRTGPRCAPSACNPCSFTPDQRLHSSISRVQIQKYRK